MLGNAPVLLLGFASSEAVHVGFPAKKQACPALRRFLKPKILYIAAGFHLGLLFLDASYALLTTRVLRPRYYHLAFK